MSSFNHRSGGLRLAAAVLLFAGLPATALAQTTWTGLGDGISFHDAANWSNGVPTNSNDAVLGPQTGSTEALISSAASIAQLSIDAGFSVELSESISLSLFGGLVNNGTLMLNSVSAGNTTDTTLTLSGTQTLGGTGVIQMSDDSDNSINGGGNAVITNAADHTIRGSGSINAFQFVNEGLIQATGTNATLILDPSTGGFDNNGRIEALGSAGLDFNGGAFDNADGTIFVADGSQAILSASAVISGGTLESVGTGRFIAQNGSRIAGVTLRSGSQLILNEVNTLTMADGITNNGTLLMNAMSGGNTTDANLTLSNSQTL
ncbi:MAG: hypothetical protein AAGB34_01070, partial [Planctomycetota bacterium]